MSSPRTRVRVRIVVELDAPCGWDDSCTVAQVRSQSIDAVKMALRRGLTIDGLNCTGESKTAARVIGDPKLVMTIVEDTSEVV